MSKRTYTRVCLDCGKVMRNVCCTRKLCDSCRKMRRNDQSRRKTLTLEKEADKQHDELVAENARLKAIGGSYGKGRLKEWLAAQKKPAGAPTPTSCKG